MRMRVETTKYLSILYFIIMVTIISLYLFSNLSKTVSEREIHVNLYPDIQNTEKNKSGNEIVDKAQQCIINFFKTFKYKTNWFDIGEVGRICSRHILNYIPYMETTPGTVERKYYMMPRTPFINDTCSVITFGIGGDIDAELHIKMMLPQCHFLGFDPNLEYKSLFEDKLGGTYVRAGVQSKNKKDVILQINKNGSGWHQVSETNLKPASKLIELHNGDILIDILNVDIEGFEYTIIDEMIKSPIYQNVCQINFEIHPVWLHYIGYSFKDVTKMFIDIAQDGTFLWAKTISNKNITYCIYFVNIKNKKCVEKYLKNRLL